MDDVKHFGLVASIDVLKLQIREEHIFIRTIFVDELLVYVFNLLLDFLLYLLDTAVL